MPPLARSSLFAAFSLMLITAACGSSTSKATGDTSAQSTTTAAPTSSTTATSTTMAAPIAPGVGPIRLVSVTGVTPTELHRAEVLIATTIKDLKAFETPAQAYAAGYRSIGDGVTGDEHYVNWSYANDGHILDPTRPESVVYEVKNGKQTAVAAMYALPFGSTFANVPDVGGALTQWHVHDNLCLTNDPQQRVVAGVIGANEPCPAGTTKAGNTPMLHVWNSPNPCGPFAALEGIGAGQVPTGETRNCDTTNASVP